MVVLTGTCKHIIYTTYIATRIHASTVWMHAHPSLIRCLLPSFLPVAFCLSSRCFFSCFFVQSHFVAVQRHQPRVLGISWDATRLGGRETMWLALCSPQLPAAMWLPPQVPEGLGKALLSTTEKQFEAPTKTNGTRRTETKTDGTQRIAATTQQHNVDK